MLFFYYNSRPPYNFAPACDRIKTYGEKVKGLMWRRLAQWLHQNKVTPPRIVAYSFMMTILIGSVLLSLPVTNRGAPASYINNLFVSTSAVCVTGLTPVTIRDQYNILGQIIVIILVQIGGLGFITFLYLALNLVRSKVSLKNRSIFQEALGQDDLSLLPRLLKTIFIYTFTIEGIGALLFAMMFVPVYGISRGLYYGIWHAISGFCNAGFDLLGSNSLINYQVHGFLNFIVCLLIITGGIGFRVVLDLYDKFRYEFHKMARFSFHRYVRSLMLHTKIVFVTTFLLLISGMLLFLTFEFSNPLTIGPLNEGGKLMVSFFQSISFFKCGSKIE